MRPSKRWAWAGFVPSLLAAAAAAGPSEFEPKRLRDHVEYLAADGLGGRDTGEPGIRRAEKYVAQGFRSAGLDPLPGRSSYFLDVTLYRRGFDTRATHVELDLGGRRIRGKAGVDLRPFPFSDEGDVTAPVVFVGYGITAPEAGWDDYEGLEVAGKLVFVLRHAPGENEEEGPFGSASNRHALFATKARVAAEHGALGMLLVTDPLHHDDADDMRLAGGLRLEPSRPRAPGGAAPDEEPFLAVHVSRELASSLVASSGQDLVALQRAVDAGTPPSALPLRGVTARVAVSAKRTPERVRARNVAAFLEGSDPELKDEWIVIGGHHDHVGAYAGRGDTIFNGADDNASGTAGVLELARVFASTSTRPRRSLAFVTFTAEEQGLLGSRALVRQRMIPVEQVVFMLNLDMIGRNPQRDVQVFGDGYTRGLRERVEAANASIGLPLEFAGAAYAGNSDHDSFYEEDVPFAFFFTGTHEDYHQVGDHPSKLDYPRMGQILQLAHVVVGQLADADEVPGFIHHVGWLGARIEVLEHAGARAATVTEVDEDSRGAAAGMRAGDVITAFDDAPLDDPGEVGRRFREVDPGSRVELALQREGERRSIAVERAKVGYLGIVPEPLDDDARARYGLGHGEGLRLRQVVADGPSAQAGLLVGDVVIQIAGRPVGMTSLRSHLARIGAGETVAFTVIREDERLTLPVTLGERPSRP